MTHGTCTCATPMPTSRRADYWDPAAPPPRCWTCGGVIPPSWQRLRELSMPPVTPIPDRSDPYGE